MLKNVLKALKKVRFKSVVFIMTVGHLSAEFILTKDLVSHSQWPRRLRHRSAAAHLLEIVGSNPTRGKDVYLLQVLCLLSGRGLCDELITRPEGSC